MALLLFELLALLFLSSTAAGGSISGTIAFATVGRAHYGFDVFVASLPPLRYGDGGRAAELQLTDGVSVNYNGHFVDIEAAKPVLRQLSNSSSSQSFMLAYVSEREGSPKIRWSLFRKPMHRRMEEMEEFGSQEFGLQGEFELGLQDEGEFGLHSGVAMHDRPAVSNGKLIFVSTKQKREESRQSWSAVYSTDISSGKTTRLTPNEVADYSPAVSPSGTLVMVASDQRKGWQGDVEDLNTDLYVFSSSDGSNRKLVVEHGGWPSWADEKTIYFHRRAEDGWWSVYKAVLSETLELIGSAERVTPAGVHAFTPAASRTGKWIAVATQRPSTQSHGSSRRHVEIFHLGSRRFEKLTEKIFPDSHHYNPFVSPDSSQVGYHRCRSSSSGSLQPRLEHISSPIPGLSLVRVDGDFPVFSPDGKYIAFIPNLDEAGIYITALDGAGKVKIFNQRAFGLFWDRKQAGVLYTSFGVGFTSGDTSVHIASILNADKLLSGAEMKPKWEILTRNGTGNNAFPSGSPDGKLLVFRSARSGYKNLYIMDSKGGEATYLRRLTDGKWDDTMPNWSPDGEWIAFSSDRHNPGGGSFQLYMVKPDGTQLHRVLNSSLGGRINHPVFSPDSKHVVFTSDFAGVSAEPVSLPNQFQPYGEIFVSDVDGSGLQRLTHNSYEDGTPSWGALVSQPNPDYGDELRCEFADPRWLLRPPRPQYTRIKNTFLCV